MLAAATCQAKWRLGEPVAKCEERVFYDYPVEVLWGTLVLAIALRHVSTDACLEDLKRNPALRLLIGIEAEDKVPDADNMSRFLARLGEEPYLTHLRAESRRKCWAAARR